MTNTSRVSLGEKIGYSLGDTASNLYFQTFVLFLLYFYTDVFGISAAAAGTMFLITRIWDAVNDPIMGMIADRTNTRWGKFRPYMLILALPFAVVGVITFTTPDFGPTGKLVYAYATYTLLMMLYTAVNVPYSALMGVLTPNSLERTEISSFRFVAAFLGGIIVQGSTMWLVQFFGKGNEPLGWQWAMGVLSGLAFVLFVITFLTTKERVHVPEGQKTAFKDDLKDLFNNLPWILIGAATVFQLIFIVVRSSSIMYYFKYYVLDQQLNLFGLTIDLPFATFASTFMLTGTVFNIIGAILTKQISKKIDKNRIYAIFLIGTAFLCVTYYFLEPSQVILIYVINIIISFFWGTISVLQWAIYTDAADYSAWKNKRRATGLVMSASLFCLKLGLTLGGAIVGWILAYYGFVANQVQNPGTINGIKMLMSIFPAVAGFLGGMIMLFYPLNNKMMIQIEKDLNAQQ